MIEALLAGPQFEFNTLRTALPDSQTTAIIQVETLAECSCCASQICGCEAGAATNAEIAVLNDLQRQVGITPQCDLNGTLCGEPR